MIPLGRDLTLAMEDPCVPGLFVTVAKCRTNGWSINNAQVNVSRGDGTRWRRLLRGGVQGMTTSGDGVMSDATSIRWMQELQDAGKQAMFRIRDGAGNVIQGYFRLPSFTVNGPHSGAQTFSFSMESSGRPYIYNILTGAAGAALGHGLTSGLAGGFPGPAGMVGLPPPGPPAPSYPPDVYTKIAPYVGSETGIGDASVSGIFWKMMGVFNITVPGSIPTFSSGGTIGAAMVCPDGTAQAFDGSPLTQVGVYYVYGYWLVLVMDKTGNNDPGSYRIQFNAQDEVFTTIRPGVRFLSTVPIYDIATGPAGSATMPVRTFDSILDYDVEVTGSTYTASHFGADNVHWTHGLVGNTIHTPITWDSFNSGDAVGYNLFLHGTITNLDPFPLPPAGAVFGNPLRSLTYDTVGSGSGMSSAGLDAIVGIQQTY